MCKQNINQYIVISILVIFLFIPSFYIQAVDWTYGETKAIPVKEGMSIRIDGKLDDWDLSYMEVGYNTEQTAKYKHAEWAVMYDDNVLYIAARIGLPERPYRNTFFPQDAFWWDDILQFRLCSDPTVMYPIDRDKNKTNNRICHISIWKNTDTNQDFIHIDHGTYINLGANINLPGTKIAFSMADNHSYTVEAKIPWSALNVPGGKNPYKHGEKMPFVIEPRWFDGGNFTANYRVNPGDFAFQSPHSWGVIQFMPSSPGYRQKPTIDQVLADLEEKEKNKIQVGVPIKISVPEDSMKLSVNIFDASGHIIRELTGGKLCMKGDHYIYWDGYDTWKHPVQTGNYKWGAYLHKGLKAKYQGSVGISGNPTYNTYDGKGGWGADHSNPVDCTSDETGLYFLWPVAEGGKAIVKTDYHGKVLWRKTPFLGGGFGEYFSLTAGKDYLYLSRLNVLQDEVSGKIKQKTYLAKLSKENGALITWPGDASEVLVYSTLLDSISHKHIPISVEYRGKAQKTGYVYHPDCMGIAEFNGTVFMASNSSGKIFLLDIIQGTKIGELICPGVRGINFDSKGNLYAVSFEKKGKAKVYYFLKGQGKGIPIVSRNLEAPYDVAVDQFGKIYVSDGGNTQQIKVFNQNGKLISTIGKPGGRPHQGLYDQDGLLNPSGICIDKNGYLLVTETSAPKVFSQFDADSGKLLNRWYGAGVYWNSTWPMPDNPKHVFYMLTGAIGRGILRGTEQTGIPDAYWWIEHTPYEFVGNLESGIPQPETIKADNNKLYIVKDSEPHAVMLFDDDILRPVCTWKWSKEMKCIEGWIDKNKDGLQQNNELFTIEKTKDGKPIPKLAEKTSSFHMEPNGDLYFVTEGNSILKLAVTKLSEDGLINWDIENIFFVVPTVLPGLTEMTTTWRHGILGVRLDKNENLYTIFNVRLKGSGGAYDFPTEEIANQLLEGMGHTSEFNAVKFAKFDKQGNLLWMAGRKATAGAADGEMYHFWNLAGIANDKYIAGASEWGQIYLYTHDGFYVDALMNNPGVISEPGPYTFGGETSGGRIQYFPDIDELWAYSSGMAYRVEGFEKGKVVGEQRLYGTVYLDKLYEPVISEIKEKKMTISYIPSGNPVNDVTLWNNKPVSTVMYHNKELAKVSLLFDEKNLYCKMDIVDESPLENSSDQIQLLFKGGDMAGLLLGPSTDRNGSGIGDIRIMAAMCMNKPCLVAMKYRTTGKKIPFEYYTPAVGKVVFDYVGEIPHSQLSLKKTTDGYQALFSVPLSFLDIDINSEAGIRGDIDLRFSGIGGRGLQAVSRNYLFTPDKSETTMTDDVPTEAKLYPEYWKKIEIIK